MSKQAPAIVAKASLAAPVNKVATAFTALDKAQAKLGDVVLSIAPSIPADDIATFCHMLKTKLDATFPDKAGSNKTQVSYVRRVLTAIVVDGVEVEPGQSLRGLYESLPKSETGGAAHAKRGAKLPNPAEGEKSAGKIVTLTGAEKRAMDINAAITTLFGTCTPDLVSAMEYAVAHSGLFMSWASASARAAQAKALESTAAEVEAALDAVKAPTRKARKAERLAA